MMRRRASISRVAFAAGAAAVMAATAACERPPVGDGGADVVEGRAVVDLPRFLQDRPAIGGKWYTYNVDGHVMEPKPEAWVVVADEGAFAVRIVSIYDDATGNSGVFHLDVAARAGDAWAAPQRFVAGTNVKEGPTCVDLVAAASVAPADRDCLTAPFHLRLQQQQRLSVFAGIAVAEPAIFLHEGVRAARIDGDNIDLRALPSPDSLAPLDDTPSYETTDWTFSELGPDLPPAGQVLGGADHVAGQTWWLWSSSQRLARLSVTPAAAPAPWAFDLAVAAIDTADFSVADDIVAANAARVDVDVNALPVYLAVTDEGLAVVPAADVTGSAPHPGLTRRWDVAVVASDDGPRLLLSPAAAALAAADPPFVP